MRILHVVPSYLPAWRYGGPIHSVHGLCKALAARGNEVDVATTSVNGEGDSDVPLDHPVDIDGVRIHYFRSRILRRLYFSGSLDRFIARRLAKFDIVHTHSVFLWPTTSAARHARRSRTPYVISPRGMLVKDLIDQRSRWVKRFWIRMFESDNIQGAAAIHVTSHVEARELLALGLRPRRLFELPNGIEGDGMTGNDCQPSAAIQALPKGYVLFLGRISWKKGLDRLIEAMATIPDLALVVAGNDEEAYWPKMERLVVSHSMKSRVFFVGYAGGEAKRALLAHATLLALPSRSENFGNVVLEAMAAGVPVVVTPEVGLAPLVESSGSGLVSSHDPEALSAALCRMTSEAGLRETCSANSRVAAQAYSWPSIAERMEAEYLELRRR